MTVNSPIFSAQSLRERRTALLLASLTAALWLLCVGCHGSADSGKPMPTDLSQIGEGLTFRKTTQSNTDLVPLSELFRFTDESGMPVTLEELAPGQPVVIIFTRGPVKGDVYNNTVCPACRTQTSRLIVSYEQFVDRGAEVVVVYPKETTDDKEFDMFLDQVAQQLLQSRIEVPFPIVFDIGLTVVKELGIEQNLAKPSTFILDAERNVRFAYVGETPLERPSISAMLEVIERIVSPSPATQNVSRTSESAVSESSPLAVEFAAPSGADDGRQ